MSEIRNILVTGATGFVGKRLCSILQSRNYQFLAVSRAFPVDFLPHGVLRVIPDINAHTNWGDVLENVDVVIHLAARVHVLDENSVSPICAFREVNVEGTLNLARQAAKSGVKRFVFVSSVAVNGASTSEYAFTENDIPASDSAYALSKWEAEVALRQLALETGLEIVIIRPPLVYGPFAKGNFAKLMAVVSRGIPLPFKSVNNLRSFIYVDNLVDALILCATHPAAKGKTYLISDGEDISTSELLIKLSMLLGRKPRLFRVPQWIFRIIFFLLRKPDIMNKLFGSLQIDSRKIRNELGWKPLYSLNEGLKATVRDENDNETYC